MNTHLYRYGRIFGFAFSLLFLVFAPGTAFGQESPIKTVSQPVEEETRAEEDLVSVLKNRDNYTFLVAALERTGMDDALAQEGPFTLLAPTDEAFAQLGEETVEDYEFDALVELIRHHLIVDNVSADQAASFEAVMTADGSTLDVMQKDSEIYVDEARIVESDIAASNGMIHGVDTVITPADGASAKAPENTEKDRPTDSPNSEQDTVQTRDDRH